MYVLSCMHRPIQLKSLSVDSSLIFQHFPSRGDSLRPQTWNMNEQQLFYLIVLTRIRTRDLCLWYHIESPTSPYQLKLLGWIGQFTYVTINTPQYLLERRTYYLLYFLSSKNSTDRLYKKQRMKLGPRRTKHCVVLHFRLYCLHGNERGGIQLSIAFRV
jgi:hypothetical protein